MKFGIVRLAAAIVLLFAVSASPVGAAPLTLTCNTPKVQQNFAPTVGNGSQTDGSQPFSFTVPAGVTSITIDAGGAQAGFGSGIVGPFGAEVAATVPVTPGDTLCVV